jgi:hypothetical protein
MPVVGLNSRPRVADAVEHVDALLTIFMFRRVTPHAVCGRVQMLV